MINSERGHKINLAGAITALSGTPSIQNKQICDILNFNTFKKIII